MSDSLLVAKHARIVCVKESRDHHARTRTTSGQALRDSCRVLCPDVVGRGQSDWLEHKQGYAYPPYLADMTALIARATEPLHRRADL
jgi:hypothetical protein